MNSCNLARYNFVEGENYWNLGYFLFVIEYGYEKIANTFNYR
jgi:hypothetical protein